MFSAAEVLPRFRDSIIDLSHCEKTNEIYLFMAKLTYLLNCSTTIPCQCTRRANKEDVRCFLRQSIAIVQPTCVGGLCQVFILFSDN